MPAPGNPQLSALRIADPNRARARVRAAVRRARGNLTTAAHELGIGRRTLGRWLAANPDMYEEVRRWTE